MLADEEAIATVAVRNLETATRFYEQTLGLEREMKTGDEVVTYKTGSPHLLVYRSAYAGTNQATAATWTVRDVAGTVRALKERGVTFEHYDMPGTRREGDLHVSTGGEMKAAWFKDPDGNILCIVGGPS